MCYRPDGVVGGGQLPDWVTVKVVFSVQPELFVAETEYVPNGTGEISGFLTQLTNPPGIDHIHEASSLLSPYK
ncbi:MAG: hypothetical protein ACO4CH_07615 [Saprospiraceae bacterium]|jgi:hypothetical protein